MKVIGLMLASNNSEGNKSYTDMVEACKKTWIADSQLDVYAVWGADRNYSLKDDEWKVVENDIFVQTKESRTNLLKKTIKGMEFALQQGFDFLFRPNCGSYIHTSLLHNFLKDKPRVKYYSGIFGTHGDTKYCSGSCTLFSRDVIELLVNEQENLNYNGYEMMDDVSIGHFLFNRGINRTSGAQRIQARNINDLEKNFDPSCYHYYFCHTINPELIYKCHNLFK